LARGDASTRLDTNATARGETDHGAARHAVSRAYPAMAARKRKGRRNA